MSMEKKRKFGIRLFAVDKKKSPAHPAGAKWLMLLVRAGALWLLAAAWWNSFLCVFPVNIETKLLYMFLLLFAVLGIVWASVPFKARVCGLALCAVMFLLLCWKKQKLAAASVKFLANAYLRVHNNGAKQFFLYKEPAASGWILILLIAGMTIPLLLFWAYVLVSNKWKLPAVLLLLFPAFLAALEGYFPTVKACWLLIFSAGIYLAACGSLSGRSLVLSCAGAAVCLAVLFLFSSVGAKPFEASKAAENGIYQKTRKAVSQNVIERLTALAEASKDKAAKDKAAKDKASKDKAAKDKASRKNTEEQAKGNQQQTKQQEKQDTGQKENGKKKEDASKDEKTDALRDSGQDTLVQKNLPAVLGANSYSGGSPQNLKAIAGFAPDTSVGFTVKVKKRPEGIYYYPEEYGGKYDGESWEQMPLGNEIYAQYSKYPDSLTRLIKLCKAQNVKTAEEAARFIQREFEKNTVYDYDPGPTPGDQDFAEYFLFKNKKGFCVHFATAATLMYRIFGFQARYAQGFAIPASAFHEQPDKTYEAKVTGDMGHAWCETYQDGWKIREHTLPYHGSNAGAHPPASDSRLNRTVTMPFAEKLIWCIIGAVLLVTAAAALFLLQGAIRRRRRHIRCRKYNNGGGILDSYQYLCDVGGFLGADITDRIDSQAFEKLKAVIPGFSDREWSWIQSIVWETLYAERPPSRKQHIKFYKMVMQAGKEAKSRQSGIRMIKYSNLWKL